MPNTRTVCSYYKWETEKTACLRETDKAFVREARWMRRDREAVKSPRGGERRTGVGGTAAANEAGEENASEGARSADRITAHQGRSMSPCD